MVARDESEYFPIALKKQLKIPVTLNSENFSNSSDTDPDWEYFSNSENKIDDVFSWFSIINDAIIDTVSKSAGSIWFKSTGFGRKKFISIRIYGPI